MRKVWKAVALSLFALVLVVGCSLADEDVSTGADSSANSSEESKDSSGEIKIPVNKETEALGLKIKVGDLKFKGDEAQLGITVNNTSSETRSAMLDMDTTMIVDGKTQLKPNPFVGDQVDSEIAGGVEQQAVLVFLYKEKDNIDPSKIKEIEIRFPEVNSEDYMSSKKPKPIKVEVKK